MIVGDLETDGLLPELTKIHCASFLNTENGKIKSFTPDTIHQLPEFLAKCDNLCFHNYFSFDGLVLKKIFNYTHHTQVFDTLLASRVLWADKEGKNPHSVATYGEEFGIAKPEQEQWHTFNDAMLHRNVEDVKIQAEIYKKIISHIEDMSISDSRIQITKMMNVFRFEEKVCEIIEQQAANGFAFDLPKAYELIDRLNNEIHEIEEELMPQMPVRVIKIADKETKAFTAKGEITAIALRWIGDKDLIGGDFCKVGFEKFNLSSSTQLKDYLLSKGWTPKEYNFKRDKWGKPERDSRGKLINTTPKTPKTIEDWEEVAEQLNDPKIKLLSMYNKANHRLHQIEGFVRNLRADHRIEAQANTCGTNTARMQHRIVVNVPKADPKIYYGTEMRSLFIAAPGKVLVGVDACALEARIEAHYIYPFDPKGADELINGDIHEKNARAFETTRQVAKGGKYALTYGCSVAKLAATIGKSGRDGKRLYDAFWEANPGLKKLKDLVEAAYDKHGYLLAIDGRPLSIRFKHALINTLFQSAGSIVMKRALVIANEQLLREKIEFKFVGNFHDEFLVECDISVAEKIKDILCEAIKCAGEFYRLNVEMAGEGLIGKNWSEVH